MAPHSSTLAWEIPGMEEPGGLQSMGSLRVRHDWATSLSFFTFMHWRRKWQPTPVFLPGESQRWEPGGLRSMGSHRVGHDWSDLAAVYMGRTDVEAEAPILWPSDMKSRLIGKDSDAGKDYGQEEKRATENEMVGCYLWLNGHEFERTPGNREGRGDLACCSPRGPKELDMT